jgi:hypothetical protein
MVLCTMRTPSLLDRNGEDSIIIESRQDGGEDGREGEPIPISCTSSTADHKAACAAVRVMPITGINDFLISGQTQLYLPSYIKAELSLALSLLAFLYFSI